MAAATPNALGVFAVGLGTTSLPVSIVIPGCPGTIHVPNPMPANQALCGQTVTAQYAERHRALAR